MLFPSIHEKNNLIQFVNEAPIINQGCLKAHHKHKTRNIKTCKHGDWYNIDQLKYFKIIAARFTLDPFK